MNDEAKKEEVKEESFTPEDFKPAGGKVGDEKIEEESQAGEPTVEDEEFNLDEVDENAPDFEPIPGGWYKFKITNMKYRSSKGGDPMMAIEHTLIDDRYPAYKGRRVSAFCLFKYNGKANDPIAEMGRKRFKKYMVRAGVTINWATFKPKEFAQSGVALGKEIMLQIGIGDPYENNEGQMTRSNNIKNCKSIGSGDSFLADNV